MAIGNYGKNRENCDFTTASQKTCRGKGGVTTMFNASPLPLDHFTTCFAGLVVVYTTFLGIISIFD
jgi:hypothetical protein